MARVVDKVPPLVHEGQRYVSVDFGRLATAASFAAIIKGEEAGCCSLCPENNMDLTCNQSCGGGTPVLIPEHLVPIALLFNEE
jgi:hypothetical protein